MNVLINLFLFVIFACAICGKEINHNESDNIEHNSHNTMKDKDIINILSPQLLKLQPSIDMSKVDGVSSECKKDFKHHLKSLEKFELWALKMHDSTAKLTSGLLNGNVNQYGDFDQCLDVVSSVEKFQGNYCLAQIKPTIPKNTPHLKLIKKLLLSNEAFKSDFDDVPPFLSIFTSFLWGFCIPSTCTNKDLELTLQQTFSNFFNQTEISFKVRVEEKMCQSKSKNNLNTSTKITLSIFFIIFLITMASTLYEMKMKTKTNPWFVAFSIIQNTKELFSLKRDAGDIPSIHGIRFFCAFMILISHKVLVAYYNPIANRTAMSVSIDSPWTVFVRGSSFYPDIFLMISGFITTYSFVGRLQRGQKIEIFQEYLSRFLRFIPPLVGLILFITYILPSLGSGPQWNNLIIREAEKCEKISWLNLLFIQNWFGIYQICQFHTYHIAIDFQLFLTAPFMVLMLWKSPKRGAIVIALLAIISTIARYLVTFNNNLSIYVLHRMNMTKLITTSEKMYSLPTYRFTIYAIGILSGFFLRKYPNLSLTKFQYHIGTILSSALLFISVFGASLMSIPGYEYNKIDAANYIAFTPIMYGIFFAWLILTAQFGYKNFLTNFLEWKGFLITTRLAFNFYIVQLSVFQYYIAETRTAEHYNSFKTSITINEMLIITLASLVLTLFFEIPFKNLKKLIFVKKTFEPELKERSLPKKMN